MSKLDEVMREHMDYIVSFENRPFSYRDFMHFEVNGCKHKMSHGFFRNKISGLKKSGEVELVYNSGIAFYTLKGHKFNKPMTPDRMGVNSRRSDSLLKMIQDLPVDENSVHDIRLKFHVEGIWEFLTTYHPELPSNSISKDILITTWTIDSMLIRVTVHRTDTVSVMVACSLVPVAADVGGIIRLSNALTRVEERLATLLTKVGATTTASESNGSPNHLKIPDHASWIIIMWHFGADASIEYSGDRFSITWKVGQNVLVRAYTKTMKDKKTRIRLECQEYPDKTFPEAIEGKLNAGAC